MAFYQFQNLIEFFLIKFITLAALSNQRGLLHYCPTKTFDGTYTVNTVPINVNLGII